MGTLLVFLVLSICVVFTVKAVLKDKKTGKCSGGCLGCNRCNAVMSMSKNLDKLTRGKASKR